VLEPASALSITYGILGITRATIALRIGPARGDVPDPVPLASEGAVESTVVTDVPAPTSLVVKNGSKMRLSISGGSGAGVGDRHLDLTGQQAVAMR